MLVRALLLLGCVLAAFPTRANQAPDDRTVVIATREAPPFAIRTDQGWSGITIELVQRIAENHDLTLRFQEMGLEQMLEAIAAGEAAAAAAALTITATREQAVDFTHPFFTSGLGIAVPVRAATSWITAFKRLVSEQFLLTLAALLGILTALGALVWLAERRHNRQFPAKPVAGIGAGMWWSAVTMTTVGYGDKAPVTALGRLVALVWMFASVIMISSFTAAIASSLTVGELDQSLSGIDDLYGRRVLTIDDSTSAELLDEKLVRYRTVANAEDALQALAAGDADAVVHDVPILRFLINENHAGRLRVLPNLLSRQDYGIALPPGSHRREAFNREILTIVRTREWERMVTGYLGRAGD